MGLTEPIVNYLLEAVAIATKAPVVYLTSYICFN